VKEEYRFSVENAADNAEELRPLYATHYAEMKDRLDRDGVQIADFKPRWEQYFAAARAGYFLNFVVRTSSGEPVGYCNVWLTSDMHNGELIAQEDTVYILPAHRNGVGKRLVQFGLDQLRQRGVKRLHVQALTDLRVEKLWRRMGFKPVATSMIFTFEGK
jgi:GNAT superfamily N-acetyltransferase